MNYSIMQKKSLFVFILFGLLFACSEKEKAPSSSKIRVIFDTDANNELDDQHALAYLLFNGDVFEVEGVTVNATRSGGDIDSQYAEAERVIKLCDLYPQIMPLKGADGSFEEIEENLMENHFDGYEAVNLIIEQANKPSDRPLVLLPVGKLTNIALALKKDPAIASKVRVVWLGSNYPEPGEYNQDNDTAAMNYILNTDVAFEMVTVRYGKASGTDAVRVTPDEIREKMSGLGPQISTPVVGRHGKSFSNFGDYAVNLFENIDLHGDPPARALFDMAAVAVVKNPAWAETKSIPCPILVDNQWVERPDNPRKIILWENFDKERILGDFFERMKNYQLAD